MNNSYLKLFLKFSFGSLISAGIAFLSTPIITALLSPSEFGKASMYTLAYGFIMQIVIVGTDQSFVRKFYEKEYIDKQSELLWESLLVPLSLSFFTILLINYYYDSITLLLINEVDKNLIYALSVSIIIGVIDRFSNLVIRMSQRATFFSIVKIVTSITSLLITFFYAKYINSNFYAIIIGTIASLFISALLPLIYERKLWFEIKNIRYIGVLSSIRYGFPFVPTFLISWVFEGIDKMGLKKYSSFSELGLFASAYKIVAVLTIIQAAFSTYWTPIAYKAFEHREKDDINMFKITFNFVALAFFFCATMIVLFKDMIIVLFDKEYKEAALIMPFLVFIPIMYTLSEITVSGINFMKKTFWHLIIALACASVNIIFVVLLIPKLGAKGAALSTAFAYIVFFYLRSFISNSMFPIDFDLRRATFCILICFINGFIATFMNSGGIVYVINSIALLIVTLIYKKEVGTIFNNLRIQL